ncbi:MAG: B12-binding domain-containing radical SAM protein [Cytophagales bacterium]|nr:B12-binding domain-containing radical SAM protein [Cytophagales bacterium]
MNTENSEKEHRKQKVLLALLPYWTPSIPPLGISCLKSHLQQHGYQVTTVDANMEPDLREIYDEYFDTVKKYVPRYKRGNFFNIGMDVMRNHMMAHINYTDKAKYIELVKVLFYHSFYSPVKDEEALELIAIIDEFYVRLEKYMLNVLAEVKPDVLGISVFSGTLPASMFAFQLAKKHYPAVKTVMGGGTFSMELHEGSPNFEVFLRKTPYIDAIIIGEGEALFLNYLEGKLAETKRVYTLRDIPGQTVDIAKVALPDFSDFDVSIYPQIGAWSSRSCPYQCSFCSETVHWGTYRKKKPRQIVEELKQMNELYGCQVFMMGDSLLNIVADGLTDEFLKEDKMIYWDGYLRTDPPVCKIENTMKWRKGGMYRARLGVESGSQKILDLMNKKITVDQIRNSVRCLAAAGIKTTTYWIVGHPGETEEDFQQTLDLIEELKDDLWEAEVNPFTYYLTGQVNSDKWMAEYKRVTLYPEEATDMLVTQTWIMEDCKPSREEIYDRVSRFVEHCEKLGIPNPYFEHEIFHADERWKKLQINAVPALIDFKNEKYIDDVKNAKVLESTEPVLLDDTEFNF